MSHPLKRTLPAMPKSLMYSVTQYLLKTKNQMPFSPVPVLDHFVERSVNEPLAMAEGFAQGKTIDKRTHFPPFFVEKSTIEEKSKLTDFIRSLTPPKSTTSLSPFFGATSFLARDGVGTYKNFLYEHSREQLLKKLRKRCWNIISDDKTTGLVSKIIDQNETKELTKGIEMMIEIILRNRRIPYGYNYYLNEVKEMKSLLSKNTKTNTLIESVKIKSIYQSAALVAQDICFQMRNKTRSFRAIFRQIVKDVQSMKGVEGIRVCVSGRLGGAEIAKSEVAKYGKTSRISFNRKVDYAAAEVLTRHGITGVKVWISYR